MPPSEECEDVLPPALGDELNPRALRARLEEQLAKARQVGDALADTLDPLPATDLAYSGWENDSYADDKFAAGGCGRNLRVPSASLVAAAQLARSLGGAPAADLLSRWQEDVVALGEEVLAVSEEAGAKLSEVSNFSSELLRLRDVRGLSQRKVTACLERKEAAQAALEKAMMMDEPPDSDVDSEPAASQYGPSEPAVSECGDDQALGDKKKKKFGWGGAKRFMGKGLKKIRGSGSTKHEESSVRSDAVSPPSAEAARSTTPRSTTPRQKPPNPKELMVQAASDELVDSADGIQFATEELDRHTQQYEAMSKALAKCCVDLDEKHGRVLLESVQEGACALEEWADQVKADLSCLGAEASDCATTAGAGASSVGSEEEDGGQGDDEEEAEQAQGEDPFSRLEAMHQEAEAYIRRLPPIFFARRLCKAGRNQVQHAEAMSEDQLIRISAENDSLEQSVQEMRPKGRLRAFRRGHDALGREMIFVENVASVASAASCWQQQFGGSSGSTSSPNSSSKPFNPATSDVSSPAERASNMRQKSPARSSSPLVGVSSEAWRSPSPGRSARSTPWRPAALSNLVEQSSSSHPSTSAPSPAFGSTPQGLRSSHSRLAASPAQGIRSNPFGEDISHDTGTVNPFADDVAASNNPFGEDVKQNAGGNPFSDEVGTGSNPFCDDAKQDAGKDNPFSDHADSSAEDDEGASNPFAQDARSELNPDANALRKEANRFDNSVDCRRPFVDDQKSSFNPFAENVQDHNPFTDDFEESNSFASDANCHANPFADDLEEPGTPPPVTSKTSPVTFERHAADNLNPFEQDSEDDDKNPFAAAAKQAENPFEQDSEDDDKNPFAAAAKQAENPFDDDLNISDSDRTAPGDIPVATFGLVGSADPEQGGGGRSPRQALVGRPAGLSYDRWRQSGGDEGLEQNAGPLASDSLAAGTPRMSTLTPGSAASLQVQSVASPHHPRRDGSQSLAGCLDSSLVSPLSASRQKMDRGSEEEESDQEVEQIFKNINIDSALAKSDEKLSRGRLGPDDGYWNWEWRDHAVEELHGDLERSTSKLANIFIDDDDWSYFAYELLLLCRYKSTEDTSEQVASIVPMCRVRLGINMQTHHHIAELSRPDGTEAFSPLDVRYRLTLLLRSWVQAESASCGLIAGNHQERTSKWIQRQLAVIKGSVAERAIRNEKSGDPNARMVCGRCLRSLHSLQLLLLAGCWGKAQPLDKLDEPSGRRLLSLLARDLQQLKPSGGNWTFNTVFTSKVFSKLWSAAIDDDSEDRLSLDAPLVAAALLSGLHPHMAALQLETHALLLAQQLWISLSACGTRTTPGGAGSVSQLPAKALATASTLMHDFPQWLQTTPFDAASSFARHGSSHEFSNDKAIELAARRLLSVDLRDGLVQVLTDYRRYLEPSAYAPALRIWEHSYREMRRPDMLASRHRRSSDDDAQELAEEEDGTASQSSLLRGDPGGSSIGEEAQEELLRRFGHWFIWKSSSAAAELILSPWDSPPEVPPGDEKAWKNSGQRIKKHLEGLAGAVQSLLDELECEKKCYNEAWAVNHMAADHLGVAAAAMAAAVRPRIRILESTGVWPTEAYGSAVLEIPVGGGRLIQVLEALDRETRRCKEPRVRPPEPGSLTHSLVDMLLPHVTAALSASLVALDRDITSHALDGSNDIVFKPLRPPAILYCEALVTQWRFIHDALDGPLSLGMPVDVVVKPFVTDFLCHVLERTGERLVRPCEKAEAFRMAERAAQVLDELASTDFAVESEDDEIPAPTAEGKPKLPSSKGRRKIWHKLGSQKVLTTEETNKHVLVDAKLLDVDAQVVSPPIPQVLVRLASVGFCLSELRDIHSKLFKAVNSGDDYDCPTERHNDARRLICDELPDLQENLEEQGRHLVRYLATRLVFWELRTELFEKLYSSGPGGGGGSTPRGASGSATPVVTTPSSSFVGPDGSPGCLTLQAIVARREDSFLSLIEQTPAHFMVPLVVELGSQLTRAWVYMLVDFFRRQKLDQVFNYVDDDQEALAHTISAMLKVCKRRVEALHQGTRAWGISEEDYLAGERRLDEVQRVAQCLVEETHTRTAEELARHAARVRGEIPQSDAAHENITPVGGERPPTPPMLERSRSQTPHGRSRSPAETGRGRSASPAPSAIGFSGRNPFGVGSSTPGAASTPVSFEAEVPSPGGPREDQRSRGGKSVWGKAWKATKNLGGKAKKGVLGRGHSERSAD